MSQTDKSNRLPFFEVEASTNDQRYGRIKASHDQLGSMGVLDYFHGFSDDTSEVSGGQPAFFVTGLSCSKGIVSSSLERALLYIAACIADDAGEEIIFRKPPYAVAGSTRGDKLWEILGVHKLLDNYDALVQQF